MACKVKVRIGIYKVAGDWCTSACVFEMDCVSCFALSHTDATAFACLSSHSSTLVEGKLDVLCNMQSGFGLWKYYEGIDIKVCTAQCVSIIALVSIVFDDMC